MWDVFSQLLPVDIDIVDFIFLGGKLKNTILVKSVFSEYFIVEKLFKIM